MSELQELKRLLVGEEADSLKRLRNRVEDRERRIKDISEALPDVIGSGDERLVAALQRPVSDCIRNSIERDPQRFADILFPVMGPAIRAAISDAMSSLVRSINQTIESTMSVQGMKWRWESVRTGVPYGEVVLRDSFVYRVEQIFLVHRGSGLLIDHAIAPEIAARDSDAVSGMLTAIQDFVRDSFAEGEGGNLREIEVGSHTVWLAHGPYAMLAAVIRGVAPESLRRRLVTALEKLHSDYGPKLEVFEGDSSDLFGVQAQLESCLELEIKQALEQNEVRRPSLLATLIKVVLGVALLSAVLYFTYRHFDSENRLSAARRIIDGTPGIVVTDVFWRNDKLNVVALADPIAKVDDAQLRKIGVDPDTVRYQKEPYQSLEQPIVLQRASKILDVDQVASTTLSTEGVLSVTGEVDYAWYRRMRANPVNIVGIRRIDLSGVSFDEDNLADYYRETFDAPSGITVSVADGSLALIGQAPQVWLDSVQRRFVPDDQVRSLNVDAVRPVELLSMRSQAHFIETSLIEFTELSRETIDQQKDRLTAVSVALKSLLMHCQTLGRSCAVLVLGNVTGSSTPNETGAMWLAEEVVGHLRSEGVPFSALKPIIGDATWEEPEAGTPQQFFVEFQVVDGDR